MFDFNDPSITVQMCKFEALIEKAHIVIKFPCSYFVEWKTINNRYSICTQKRVRTSNDQAIFHQKLTFYTEMVFNAKKKEYYSKETFILLNLVSKSRPDQVKLVGRVSVDLADVLNRGRFAQVQRVRLNYCSVEGSVVFGIKLLNKRESNLSVKDLDRSAFTDYFSLNPINRMLIEQSINNKNFTHTGSVPQRQQGQYRQESQQQSQQREQPASVPTFGDIREQSHQQNKTKESIALSHWQYQREDEQVISFQNSERHERFVGESPRTNYSREQSLIEKLSEKNLKASQKEYNKHQKQPSISKNLHQKLGNVVEVQARQPRTERINSNQGCQNNSASSYTVGSRTRGLNRVEEEIESGQIRRQQGITGRAPSQTNLQAGMTSAPVVVSKPTSPPSYERQLISQDRQMTYIGSSSKYSEVSESQNQQLLQIVEKLEHQKLEQQSMIQSLRAMLVNKNMKKKEVSKSQSEESQQKKNQEILDQNATLRKQNDSLIKEIQVKGQELRQKNMHVFELLDKIKRLQTELAKHDQKIKLYEEEIAELHMKEIENQKVCQSLKLSLTMQPGYDNLVRGTNGIKSGSRHDQGNEKEDEMGLLTKKSSKLLEQYKTSQPSSIQPIVSELQSQRLSHSQEPQAQDIRITITKDEKIYEQIEQENEELTERVKQLMEEIQIYKDLLKQQNNQPLKQSIPILPVQTINNQLELEDVPFTITVSKNTNIYANYENLEQENDELYSRVKELEQQVESYKQLMRQEYPGTGEDGKNNFMTESVQVQDMGEYHAGVDSGRDVSSSQPPINNSFQSQHPNEKQRNQNHVFQTSPLPETLEQVQSVIGETFRIILTKDKNIYKQQEQENIELSQRVIELEQQIKVYKELLKEENQAKSTSSINLATKENEQCYESQGFKITFSKDKNIYENQENEIAEYEQQVKQLEDTLQKYVSLYGAIGAEPEYKVSITREDRIYDDQEQEIKELFKCLQEKDDQVMELTSRLSWLEKQLEFKEDIMGSGLGEFKINIHRDENIYDEQENDIKELSERLVVLEGQLKSQSMELCDKDDVIEKLKTQLQQLSVIIKNNQSTPSQQPVQKQSARQRPHSPKPSEFTPPTLSCLACVSLHNHLLELETTVQLIEEQKNMLEQQLGTLEQQKFCFTSTENQLKITIEDLREEINLLGQENERLADQLQFLQQYHFQREGNMQHDQQTVQSQHCAFGISAKDGPEQKDSPEDAVDRSKFALSLPQNAFSHYRHTYTQTQLKHPTQHLQQLTQSPRSKGSEPHSPKPSRLLLSLQQQNSHLRQSLGTFQQQLQEQYLTISELQQRIARLMHEKQILFERDQQLSKEIIMLSEKEQEVNEREVRLMERIGELEKELTSIKAQSMSTVNTSHVARRDSTEQNASQLKIIQLDKELTVLKDQFSQVSELLSQSSHQLNLAERQIKLREQQFLAIQQQLQEKQRQTYELQAELESQNSSLNELSLSYQCLQKNILELQLKKEAQVESIRQEYETMNRLLKDDLESIESIILEKQRVCEEKDGLLWQKEQEIERLGRQVEWMTVERENSTKELSDELALVTAKLRECESMNEQLSTDNNSVRQANQDFMRQNSQLSQQVSALKQQIEHLYQLKPQIPLSPEQLNYKQKLLKILVQIRESKQQRDIELSQFLPIISEKLNQAEFPVVIHGEEQLARLIAKELQKIKINVMRNYQISAGGHGLVQKTAPIKTGYNQDFKTFAEKSAMLNYLKPIEELIKGY